MIDELLVRGLRPAPHLYEIRLSCPERLNAIDEDVLGRLNSELDVAAKDDEVRVVVISGEGRAFCAGANYKKHVKGERTMAQKRQYINLIFDTYRRIYRFEKPVVAAVHGIAAGAGAELAVNCDFIVAEDEAEIWFPETSVGTFVGCGATVILPRIVGLVRARQLLMKGERISARHATEIGLFAKTFPQSAFRAGVLEFATEIAMRAPIAARLVKQHLNDGIRRDYDDALIVERDAVLACMLTEDWSEGVRAFAEKRKPVFKGS